MKRWDFVGGIWCRVGRWWVGLVATFPFLYWAPVIAGGAIDDGMPAQGSYLLLEMTGSPGSPTTMSEIPRVENIGGGGGTTEQIDFTHLRSTGRRREFKPGFIDDGNLTFSVQYITGDPVHQAILAYFESGERVALREVFPDAAGWDYTGAFESVQKSGQSVGGKIMLDISFKLSGAVNFSGTGSPA